MEKEEYLPKVVDVKYKNRLNGLNLKKLNGIEHNVLMSLFATLKDQGDREIDLSFDKFREMSGVTTQHFKNNALEPLINNTLTKIGSGSIHISDQNSSIIFPLFDKIVIDNLTKNIKLRVSETFQDYFNYFVSEYISFPLQDFINIKGKYTKNLYKKLMQFKNTGMYKDNYDNFLYEVMGAPEKMLRKKGNNQIVAPAVKELRNIGYFQSLEYSFTKENKEIKNIVFTFQVAKPNPINIANIKDENLRSIVNEREKAKELFIYEGSYCIVIYNNAIGFQRIDGKYFENVEDAIQYVEENFDIKGITEFGFKIEKVEQDSLPTLIAYREPGELYSWIYEQQKELDKMDLPDDDLPF